MPPRKRKPALAPIVEQDTAEAALLSADNVPAQVQQVVGQISIEELKAFIHEKTREMELELDRRCQVIQATAQEIKASMNQEIQLELLKLPKQVREMLILDYHTQYPSEGSSEQQTAANTTDPPPPQPAAARRTSRAVRARAASGLASVPEGAPRTTRRSKATASAAADGAENMPPATVAPAGKAGFGAGFAQLPTTAVRRARAGEMAYSVNGSPIITGSSSPTAAAAAALPSRLATPAVPLLPLPAQSLATLGPCTLVKKEAATSRRAGARGRAKKQAEPAAMGAADALQIETADGSKFVVEDSSCLEHIPERYRQEVQEKLAAVELQAQQRQQELERELANVRMMAAFVQRRRGAAV